MVDKRLDTVRTTNLPVMEAADALLLWGDTFKLDERVRLEAWTEPTAATRGDVEAAPLKAGERLSVYWTDMQEWYPGTYKCSRVETGDDGARQRSSCILYDAVGAWAKCSKTDLTYWHCLSDEIWTTEKE